MYCEKCGTRIRPGKARCDKCGAPAPAPDYCGGFWGLLSRQDGAADTVGGREASAVRDQDYEFGRNAGTAGRSGAGGVRIGKPKESFWSKATIPAIAAAALFLVVLIVVSVRGGGERTRLQDQLSRQNEQLDQLKSENTELESRNTELDKELTTLKGEKEELEGTVTKQQEEINRLSRHLFGTTWTGENKAEEEEITTTAGNGESSETSSPESSAGQETGAEDPWQETREKDPWQETGGNYQENPYGTHNGENPDPETGFTDDSYVPDWAYPGDSTHH